MARLGAQIGNHTVKSGSALQSFTAVSIDEAESYAVVNGCQVGLSLRSMHQDLGIPMQIEIQSDNSTANSRGTSGYKNESKMETSISRRCLQRRTAQMLERS